MWNVNNQDLKMCEGDWGIKLPITISGTTLTASDELKLVIKKAQNGDAVLTKVYTDISQNTVELEFTEAESALLPVGTYCYTLDWYQSGVFMCNIIPYATLRVVDKA